MRRTLPIVLTGLTASLATLLIAPSLVGQPAIATEQAQAVEGDRIATIDVFALLERALDLPDFAQARDTLQIDLQAQGSAMQAQLQKLNDELGVLVPGDPAINQKQTELQTLYQQYQTFQQQAPQRFDQLAAQQGSEAYWMIVHRAREIAAERGYSHMLVSRLKADEFVSANVSQAMQEILARPVIMTPPGDDLTDVLMDDLNLPPAPEPAASDAPADAPTTDAPADSPAAPGEGG